MDIATIDFETFYDQDYSLSKLTTEEYVRSPLFEIIGVSVKVNNHPTDWYSGGHPDRFLKSLDYSDKAILCHNTAFDGAILSWRMGIRPKFWLDTLSMARPKYAVTVGGSLHYLAEHLKLGHKGDDVVRAKGKRRADFTPQELAAYGKYCANDTDLTYALFNKLKEGFPVSELMVINQLIRMYTEPMIELDTEVLGNHLKDVVARKQALLDKLGGSENALGILRSNPKFADLLSLLGVDPPMKVSRTTGKTTYAFAKTDQAFLDLLEHPDPRVSMVVEARLGTKTSIEETRTQRLLDVASRGALPVMLKYYAAHTGRLGGGDKLNMQNLPVRTGNTIRRALKAPRGRKVLACDSAQIEARTLAYVAGQHDLVQAFRQGRDVYSEFASDVYGYPVDRKHKEIGPDGKEYAPHYTEGFVGKTCILGLGYGMGHIKFRATLKLSDIHIDEHEARRIVYLYRGKYHAIPNLWSICDWVLADMVAGRGGVIANLLPYDASGITLPNGLKIAYPALRVAEGGSGFEYISDQRVFRKFISRIVTGGKSEKIAWTPIYGGKVVENIIQALARIIVTEQMTAIGMRYPVVLQVHDENVALPRFEEVDAAQRFVEQVMSTPPTWAPGLPIACESGVGDNYGEAK